MTTQVAHQYLITSSRILIGKADTGKHRLQMGA